MFPGADPMFVPRVFGWAIECFTGNYRDYQAVDARYHDFEHTLQGTLCLVRLLHGRHLAGAQPPLTQPMFQLGLVAMLLHDTGYLKKREDTQGTGAKYTVTHVHRSAEFAAQLLKEKGFSRQRHQGRAEHDSLHRRKRSAERDSLSERTGTNRRLGSGHR